MKEKIKELLHSITEREIEDQNEIEKSVDYARRVLEVCDYVKQNTFLLNYKKVSHFFTLIKLDTITNGDLFAAEEIINRHKLGKDHLGFIFKENKEYPLTLENEIGYKDAIIEYESCKELLEIRLKALKYLNYQAEIGNDITNRKYASWYLKIGTIRINDEEKNAFLSLFRTWAIDLNEEYMKLSEEVSKKQEIGPIISLRNHKEGNYPSVTEESLFYDDVKEKANYIRSLVKLGEIDLAISLMESNQDAIVFRILYEIETEKAILEKEMKDDKEVMIELQNELEAEKQMLFQVFRKEKKQWIK